MYKANLAEIQSCSCGANNAQSLATGQVNSWQDPLWTEQERDEFLTSWEINPSVSGWVLLSCGCNLNRKRLILISWCLQKALGMSTAVEVLTVMIMIDMLYQQFA